MPTALRNALFGVEYATEPLPRKREALAPKAEDRARTVASRTRDPHLPIPISRPLSQLRDDGCKAVLM